jgi:hypothetical protein
MYIGAGIKLGAQITLQTPVPAIVGASDLFVSVSRVSADVPAYFKLSLVESFACTNQKANDLVSFEQVVEILNYSSSRFPFHFPDSLPRLAGTQITVPAQLIDSSAADDTSRMWSGILQLPQAGSIVRLDFQCGFLGNGAYNVRVYDQGDTSTSSASCNPCAFPFSCKAQGSTKVLQ